VRGCIHRRLGASSLGHGCVNFLEVVVAEGQTCFWVEEVPSCQQVVSQGAHVEGHPAAARPLKTPHRVALLRERGEHDWVHFVELLALTLRWRMLV
jgi:hypothetical protein